MQMKKTLIVKRALSLVLALIVSAGMLLPEPMTAEAAVQTVPIVVTYGQSEARAMLDMINGFRTSETEAWAYNEAGEKVAYDGLNTLSYDYELERIAMKRAEEIALSYSHTRPNGTSCFTLYNQPYGNMGENIAAGYTSAASVFVGWREDNCDYSSQGHRRNMLKGKFKAVGIGHVKYMGVDYWVQEFSSEISNPTDPGANDQTAVANVEVDDSYIGMMKATETSFSLKEGETKDLSDLKLALVIRDFWGMYADSCVTCVDYSASVADTSVAVYDGGKLTGVSEGTTTLTLSAYGKTCDLKVTVKVLVLENAQISFSSGMQSFIYTGNAIEPAITVTLDGSVLIKDSDYNVVYQNNIYVGTATVTVTGLGNYTGIKTAAFQIIGRPISSAVITQIADQTYTGAALTPQVTVRYGGANLINGIDYAVAYSNNVNPGIATVTVTGKGNYTGSRSISFKIVEKKKDIGNANVNSISDQKYTGKDIKPSLTVKYEGMLLKEGTDYTLSYKNNIKPGTATAVISGIGKYTGTKTVSFLIKEAKPTAAQLKASVALSTTSKSLKKGKAYQIKFKNTLQKSYVSKITYSSSNKKVAVVSKKGKVTAKAKGSAVITCKVSFTGGVSKTVKLKIKVK